MTLNFPSSPTNGQVFGSFTYDSSLPGWRSTPDLASGMPAGTIVQWPSNTTPANWLICDGSAVSRSAYASLFSAIGTTYGTGDGSTTFNLPNLKGRVPVGRDSAQTEFDTLGETGGAKSVTLSSSQIPSHTHSFSATTSSNGAHTHEYIIQNPGWVSGSFNSVLMGALNNQYTNGAVKGTVESNGAHTHTFSGTTGATGGGEAHNNLQPYIVLNYIIKVSAGITAGDSELATRLGILESTVNYTPHPFLTMGA